MMKQWFENNNQYYAGTVLPPGLEYSTTRREGIGLVRVYPGGVTQPGWGAKDFEANYVRGNFNAEKPVEFFNQYGEPFAIIMRSIPVICVDIDGKNGGIETARVLELPETTAERSKSGNGYHLFYEVPKSTWKNGYDEFPDLIGLLPGIDIKGVGVVYHYPNQVWNRAKLSILPVHLAKLIGRVRDVKRVSRITRLGVSGLDEEETAVLHDEIEKELAQPMPEGSRNRKLYAIGARMLAAGVPAWDQKLYDRGLDLGLEIGELEALKDNIEKYS